MLSQGNIVAMVAVSDLEKAKEFYGGTLGLQQTDENMGGVTYSTGEARLFVYQAPTAGTNQATSFTIELDDIEAAVEELKGKGITFEHYEMPGSELQGDIMVMGPMKAAWFKDFDGNTIGLGNKF